VFGEKLKTFIDTVNTSIDAESSNVNRKVILQFLKEDPGNVYHESYVLYVLSHTSYDVSTKYLMPRLAGLSTLLATKNDKQRRKLLKKLKQDTVDVQQQVKQLIKEQKTLFQKAVDEKRAQINQIIDQHTIIQAKPLVIE